jgi:hypothetical protein
MSVSLVLVSLLQSSCFFNNTQWILQALWKILVPHDEKHGPAIWNAQILKTKEQLLSTWLYADWVAICHVVTYLHSIPFKNSVAMFIFKTSFQWWIVHVCQVHTLLTCPSIQLKKELPDSGLYVTQFNIYCFKSKVTWHNLLVWQNSTTTVYFSY